MSRTGNGNNLANLPGITQATAQNPYSAIIDACAGDPKQINLRYRRHREARNEQQKAELLSPHFTGFIIDPVLQKLLDQQANRGYEDPRHCLVLWARPPQRVQDLVREIQRELLEIAPNLWLMPLECLHMTVLEIAHSQTEHGISRLVEIMEDKIPQITDYTYSHRARLAQPLLSYDSAAIALSFLPAAGAECHDSQDPKPDDYTYHHLRHDIYALSRSAGVEVASRYVVPSSHITIARFVTQRDIIDVDTGAVNKQKIGDLVAKLTSINNYLRTNHWSDLTTDWHVGEDKGLVCRKGTVWYGGGQSQHEGRGF